MNTRTQNLFVLLSLLAAIASIAAFSFFSWELQREHDVYAAARLSAMEASARQASAARTHAIVATTQMQRTELNSFLGADVVSAATLISNVGKTTGVTVQLSNALPLGTVSPQTATSPAIHAVGFVVEAKGSFAALMRTEKLLETLPLPSRVMQLDIQTTPSPDGTTSGQWHMSVSLQVLTTAAISS